MDKLIVMSCPSGSLNTDEKYLWCNKFDCECQNCKQCSFKAHLFLAINELSESDKLHVAMELNIGGLNYGN